MNKLDIYESETVERDDMTFHVDWVYDYNADPDFMGEYFRKLKRGAHYVDRPEGILYSGKATGTKRTFRIATDSDVDIYPWNVESEVFNLRIERDDDRKWLDECQRLEDEDGYAEIVDHYDLGTPIEIAIHRYIDEVLADNLSTNHVQHEYQYWGRSQSLPHNPKNWAHVVPQNQELTHDELKLVAEHGIRADKRSNDEIRDIIYACRDYERMEDLNRGDWCFVGCVATLITDGEDFGSTGLWGIESDSDDAHKKEIANEQIDEIIGQLPEQISERRGILDKLARILDAREALR